MCVKVNKDFGKTYIYHLHERLGFPGKIVWYNGLRVSSIESLCKRYLDMMLRFARSIPQIYMIVNQSIKTVLENWSHFPRDFNQELLTVYADRIHKTGAPIDNCWDFVDGIVRPICRPTFGQRQVYNGHKKSILLNLSQL